MKKITLLMLFATSCSLSVAQQNFDTVKIRPLKITDNIYMLRGAGGNIGILIGKEGTLMVDDQYAPLSNRINGAIKTIDPGEIRFLINTHIHGDHSGGNENFKRMNATIVAQNAVRERMGKEIVDNRGTKIPPRDKDAWPTITFNDRMDFHLNDEDIQLIHIGPAHTDGDVLIRFVNANVYHTGDVYNHTGFPFVDVTRGGGISGFISALDKMLTLMDDNAKVIPGHGKLSTKADVKFYRDMIVDIRDQVATALKKGKKVEDLGAMGITDKYEAEWGKGFIKGKDLVLVIAENLKATPGK